MPPLNPFLRALFQSSALSQALQSPSFVLLVPTTVSLLYARDRENGKRYTELVEDEDFLASHILRIEADGQGKDLPQRENRGKAKTYTTVNSRTLILKDNIVYTSKGFRGVLQAQILNDYLYQSPGRDNQQWLIITISKPLVGQYESDELPLPIVGGMLKDVAAQSSQEALRTPSVAKPRAFHTFGEVLSQFPLIARHMVPGVEVVITDLKDELDKYNWDQGSGAKFDANDDHATSPDGSKHALEADTSAFIDLEDVARKALETAVTGLIDLFRAIDKQQLSALGATTDLTGPDIERLLEIHVSEMAHEKLLWPRLLNYYAVPDRDLDKRIYHMSNLDIAQAGIDVEDEANRTELMARIEQGVKVFAKMNAANSPHQMLAVLVGCQKTITEQQGRPDVEKTAAITINADVLMSLLLLVVIRGQVRHLNARLSYMQKFIFVEDVENGEFGYALSTFEAVLAYIVTDSGNLRSASKRNGDLWNAIRCGNVRRVTEIVHGNENAASASDSDSVIKVPDRKLSRTSSQSRSVVSFLTNGDTVHSDEDERPRNPPEALPSGTKSPPKQKKKVKLHLRSVSVSSSFSALSKSGTLDSRFSRSGEDLSETDMSRVRDPTGNSALMIAVEAQQPGSLSALLDLEEFSSDFVLADTNAEGASLLVLAVQSESDEVVQALLDYLEQNLTLDQISAYVRKQDHRGRSVAHYIYNKAELMDTLSDILPWQQKDHLGQTPLYAVCRAYDHKDYHSIVSRALVAAKAAQSGRGALRLDDHTDNKGNTLLHIITDAILIHRVLRHCDLDINATNDKKFTPLMLVSKYGRLDIVRVLFGDARVDPYLREIRGLTAVELAKDDEIRNKIDDLTLFSGRVRIDSAGRLTSIVRAFLVDDGSSRYILKSGSPHVSFETQPRPSTNTAYTITTSRRSIEDFENLASWIARDRPASYIPDLSTSSLRSCFPIHSRPIKSILLSNQAHLNSYLTVLLCHPSFGSHEVLWEFLLVPDMQQSLIVERQTTRAALVHERISEDYEPLTSIPDLAALETLVHHSLTLVRRQSHSMQILLQRGRNLYHSTSDLAEAVSLLSGQMKTLGPPSSTLPAEYTGAMSALGPLLHVQEPQSSPTHTFLESLAALNLSLTALQASMNQPLTLRLEILRAQKAVARHRSNIAVQSQPRAASGSFFGLALPNSEETRLRQLEEEKKKTDALEREIDRKGRLLSYTREVVLDEFAGWTSWKEGFGRAAVRQLVEQTLIKEREKLRGMHKILDRVKGL